jgi:putative spermidine/putrescine transport system ATP-binding protein
MGDVVTTTDTRLDRDASPGKEQTDFLVLKGLTKRYGDRTAVDHLDVSVRNGELIAFLGPSGCGKTTTLRMIAGFIKVDDGSIDIAGKRVDTLPSRLRETAMVFQDYALFPHMTVGENVAFGLKMRKVKKAEIAKRVRDVLELVQLHDVEKKYPRELSGGMRQRVALARAIVVEPQILLLDEPLSNLDAKLRKQLRTSLKELHERIGITTVFVTHDIEEAFYLADRVVVMNAGQVEQFDTPQNIYSSPKSLFVADFIGHTNIIEGELRPSDAGATFVGADVRVVTDEKVDSPAPGRYIIPPHLIRVDAQRPSGPVAVQGRIALSAFLGASYSVIVEVGATRLQADLPDASLNPDDLAEGRAVWLSWDPREGHYVAD